MRRSFLHVLLPRVSGWATSAGWLAMASVVVAQVPAYTVHPDYVAQHFTIADGLPVNSVTGLAQGRDGYLWMTTFDGFVRFDGHRFTVFNTSNSPKLPSNRLWGLRAQPDGTLAMLTESGELVRYQAGHFETFGPAQGVPGHIHAFFAEEDTLWLLTDEGLAYLVGDAVYRFRPDVIQGDIRAVPLREAAGVRWVAVADKGLYRFAPDGTFAQYTFPDEPVGASMIWVMVEDAQGTVWVGTGGAPGGPGALYRFDKGRFVRAHDRGWSWQIRDIQLVPGHPGRLRVGGPATGWWIHEAGQMRRFPAVEPGGGWGCLTASEDLWCFEGHWLYRDTVPILRSVAPQEHLLLDDEANLWVGGNAGLYRLKRRPLQTLSVADGLPHDNIYPILEDRRGRIWLGLWGAGPSLGVARVEAGRIQRFAINSCCVSSLYEDRQGTVWVGSTSMICGMRQGQCVGVPEGLGAGNGTRAMYEDRAGRFWIGQEGGLWQRAALAQPPQWTHFTTAEGLTHDWVRVLTETHDGHLLLGTNGGGLMRYHHDPATGHAFEPFTTDHGLASNFVRDIHPATDGHLWVATEDRGLCRLDRYGQPTLQAATIRCLTTEDGLFDNGLHRILEDDYGRFWFNTNRGIFHVEHAELNAFAEGERSFVTSLAYTERDGMLNREGNGGVQPAGIKASDGRLWFPTQGGAVIIDPSRVERPSPPSVVIEQVEVSGMARGAGTSLVLAPGERDVEIAYAAVVLSGQEEVQFQYQLDGYDADWREAGDRRRAVYTNLSPGQYIFRVRARRGGVWSASDATLALARLPFFWETGWFVGLVLLALGLSATGFYRFRLHRLEARQAELESLVRERTAKIREHEAHLEAQAAALRQANVMKSQFLANISHEFRTPLTLTFGPINDLLSGRYAVALEAKPQLERARRNGERLLRLINQLLDLSRLDAGKLRLVPTRQDLVAFVRQRVAAFTSLADERGIALRFLPDVSDWSFGFDRGKLETVLLNLLSNALKFTPAGGTVLVMLGTHAEGQAVLVVRDTGHGIAPAYLPHLFDRFYQVDASTTRAQEGSGLGLALVQQLVELHGGTVSVESTVGVGTTFTIHLPDQALEGEASGDGTAQPAAHTAVQAVLSDLHTQRPPLPDPARVDKALGDAPVVLVVEDNADMRAYIRTHLTDLYQVYEAEDGRHGQERALDLVPDLVLSDVMMPEMDGVELLTALKADLRTSHIPVVLLTAKADAASRLKGLETGADDYLAKPFDAAELRARVANLIAQRQQLRALWSHAGPLVQVSAVELPSMEAAFLEEVRSAVEAKLADPRFDVGALADAVGMSPRQLRRKLRSLLDESPQDMLRRLRLERAAMLLEQRAMTVKEVAAAVGFRGASHFSQRFQEAYGTTPTEFARAQG